MPNLIWQWQHGFPTLEDLANVRASGKNVKLPPLAFLAEQVLMVHPVLLPLWLAGLWFFLAGRGTRYRALGWIYLVLVAVFMALHGKNYYVAPAYPMLLAGGACALEGWLASWPSTRERLWPRAALAGLVGVAGAVLAPLALPLLSPQGCLAYTGAIGLAPKKTEVAHEGPLPQGFGDQFGWPELVAEVARIYHSLPPEERAKAVIFASNYGEAGAINLFGPRHGLPPAISAHQTHSFWGYRDASGDVLIWTQAKYWDLENLCTSVEIAGFHRHPWGMEEENGPIAICRGLKTPLPELWPRLKH